VNINKNKNKIMEKFDKEKAYQEMLDVFNRLGKITNPIEQGLACLTEIPKFLEKIWRDGALKGIEEGKKQKIDTLSKQN
jgi:hypothetical protein